MRNIQDFLETLKLSFNSAFSICMNVPLRLDSHLPKNFCVMLFISDEKCFFFSSLNLFSFSRYLSLCSNVWSCRKNSLIRKIILTSKFLMQQPGLQTITMHILPNISESTGNQTMKFGQLIEYNKINIFLEKLDEK